MCPSKQAPSPSLINRILMLFLRKYCLFLSARSAASLALKAASLTALHGFFFLPALVDLCFQLGVFLVKIEHLALQLLHGRPDMTFAVDWALSNNYLSIYPPRCCSTDPASCWVERARSAEPRWFHWDAVTLCRHDRIATSHCLLEAVVADDFCLGHVLSTSPVVADDICGESELIALVKWARIVLAGGWSLVFVFLFMLAWEGSEALPSMTEASWLVDAYSISLTKNGFYACRWLVTVSQFFSKVLLIF